MKTSERDIHLAFCQYIRLHENRLKLLWFHVPNEAKRSKATGKLLKNMGMLPGVSDFIFLTPSRLIESDDKPSFRIPYMAVEMKRDQKAPVSQSQLNFIQKVNATGGMGGIAYGLNDAIDMFNAFYGIKIT